MIFTCNIKENIGRFGFDILDYDTNVIVNNPKWLKAVKGNKGVFLVN